MDSDQLLTDAVSLMVLGIGTVFVFLAILVCLTSLMSAAVNRLVPAPAAAPTSSRPQPAPGTDDVLPAVISAAIHAHRSRR